MSLCITVGGTAAAAVAAMTATLNTLGVVVKPFPESPVTRIIADSSDLPGLTKNWSRFDYAWRCWPPMDGTTLVWCTHETNSECLDALQARCLAYGLFVSGMVDFRAVIVCPTLHHNDEAEIGLPSLSQLLNSMKLEKFHKNTLTLEAYHLAIRPLFHDMRNGSLLSPTGAFRANNGRLFRQLFEGMREDMKKVGWQQGSQACDHALTQDYSAAKQAWDLIVDNK